ncbi:MAG: hypothetical protein WAX69_04750 [Victivallales bacterium]
MNKTGRTYIISAITAMLVLTACAETGIAPAQGRSVKLEFVKAIGDVRGKSWNIISVDVDARGNIYLLSMDGRVMIFDHGGKYQKSLKTASLSNSHYYARAMLGRILIGNYRSDFPWVFNGEKGSAPGSFDHPSMVAIDDECRTYVCDTANKRIQIFPSLDGGNPINVLSLDGQPSAVAVRDGRMAVITRNGELLLYSMDGNNPVLQASGRIGGGGTSVCIEPGGGILVAFNGPGGSLMRFAVSGGHVNKTAVIAPSVMEQWPNIFTFRVPLTRGTDNEIWFATDTYGKILSLDPKTDTVKERIKGLYRPLCVGFWEDGSVFVSGWPRGDSKRTEILVFDGTQLDGKGKSFLPEDKTFPSRQQPNFSILPDKDGGVYTRVFDKDDWTGFIIKKLFPDGRETPVVDTKTMTRTRARNGFEYSLQYTAEGDILLANHVYGSVVKMSREGKVLWIAGANPAGGADKVELAGPVDTGIDSKGRIWVADARRSKIVCLSPEGKFLYEHGGRGGVDDVTGKSFDWPTGVECATIDGQDFLYIGDSGNGRILKFKIEN